jgi:hypothetical protein
MNIKTLQSKVLEFRFPKDENQINYQLDKSIGGNKILSVLDGMTLEVFRILWTSIDIETKWPSQ